MSRSRQTKNKRKRGQNDGAEDSPVEAPEYVIESIVEHSGNIAHPKLMRFRVSSLSLSISIYLYLSIIYLYIFVSLSLSLSATVGEMCCCATLL
jgi:hypothetical protein